MLVANQDTTQEKKVSGVVLNDEIDTILSDLADIIIDDYLSQVATRCYTEIKSVSELKNE